MTFSSRRLPRGRTSALTPPQSYTALALGVASTYDILHFLGIVVEHCPNRLILQQYYYTLDILEYVGMMHCKSCADVVDK